MSDKSTLLPSVLVCSVDAVMLLPIHRTAELPESVVSLLLPGAVIRSSCHDASPHIAKQSCQGGQ